jgi:hypothetical protein
MNVVSSTLGAFGHVTPIKAQQNYYFVRCLVMTSIILPKRENDTRLLDRRALAPKESTRLQLRYH